MFSRCLRGKSACLLWLAIMAAWPVTAFAAASTAVSTTVGWNSNSNPKVTGYNLYYGTNSHAYTKMISVGNATSTTVSNLNPAFTYYFAATTHDAAGHESPFSSEASFDSYNLNLGASGLHLYTQPPALTNDVLQYSLAPGAPAGAWINPTNGLLSWNPGFAYNNSSNTITVNITDLTNPGASTQATLLLNVSDYLDVTAPSVPVQAGGSASLPFSVIASDTLTNLVFNLAWPGYRLQNPSLAVNFPMTGGTILSQGTNLCISIWTTNGAALVGTNQICQVNFQAAAGQSSAFLSLPISGVATLKSNGSSFSVVNSGAGEAVVVGTNPLLRPQVSATQGRLMTLYANPGTNYILQYCTNLSGVNSWQTLQNYQPTNVSQIVSLDSAHPNIYYRLVGQ